MTESRHGKRGAGILGGSGFFQEIIVAAGKRGDLSTADVQLLGRKLPDEMHVVGNENQRALVSAALISRRRSDRPEPSARHIRW